MVGVNMKKITIILAAVAIAIIGCQEELIPDDVPLENNGSSGNGGDDEDPRGGKILDEGLAFYNMPGGIFDLDEGTYDTPETIGRIPLLSEGGTLVEGDEEGRLLGKYLIRGPSAVSTSKLDSGGFTDVAFLYYNEPLAGEFTLRARVLITAKAGDSSSKGYFFGAFTGEPILEGGVVTDYKDVPGTTSLGAGILYRTNDTADNNSGGPSMRPYFKEFVNEGASPPGGWSTGPSQSSAESGSRIENWMNFRQPGWRQERIIEVSRENRMRTGNDGKEHTSVFVLKVYNSKSEDLLETAYIYDNSINSNLLVGNPVYAGIALLGTSVEFSEMSLWDNADKSGEPIFKTPETTPAYVAVDSVKIAVSRNGGITTSASYATSSLFANCGKYTVSSVADGQARPISLSTVMAPTYADNPFVDWSIEFDNADGKITVVPTDGDEKTGWEKADIVVEGSGTVIIMATSRDPGLADHCLELVVN
jgi:hypothetical protein